MQGFNFNDVVFSHRLNIRSSAELLNQLRVVSISASLSVFSSSSSPAPRRLYANPRITPIMVTGGINKASVPILNALSCAFAAAEFSTVALHIAHPWAKVGELTAKHIATT